MRTNVDLPSKHLTALRTLAAQRGLRGFSRLVTEAVEEYLAKRRGEDEEGRLKAVRKLRGSISDAEAKYLRQVVRENREEKA